MRAAHSDSNIRRYGPRDGVAFAQQRVRANERRGIKLPRWRHQSFGYLAMFPLVAVTMYLWQMHLGLFLPGAFLSLALVLIAFLWGAWPATVMLILAIGCLDYLIVPPGDLLPTSWMDGSQLLLTGVVGLLLIWLMAWQECARLKALVAQEEALARVNELEVMNQMKDRFISMASHELKTPITTIRVQAQFMQRRLSQQKDARIDNEFLMRSLQRIDEQTARLTMLIMDLLDRNERGNDRVILNRKMHDLCEMCQKVIEDQRLLTGREIVLHVPVLPIEASVDADRLSQVIINVVGNALKYSPKGSVVEVSVSQSAGSMLMQVRDQGSGIAKEDLPRIFEMFYRTPDAQASHASGFGLGLAITKEIIELHGGRIWCESELGRGSTFFIELPLGDGE
jgi:signal transduction histidine kinase